MIVSLIPRPSAERPSVYNIVKVNVKRKRKCERRGHNLRWMTLGVCVCVAFTRRKGEGKRISTHARRSHVPESFSVWPISREVDRLALHCPDEAAPLQREVPPLVVDTTEAVR